ncbi:hypothetical protein BV20DRAFT_556921 [Pilatotrama ljubarskyi]|nr:hypothetical protein BV20DRAFT_556921 [Pilatotrama ljubarskyi]
MPPKPRPVRKSSSTTSKDAGGMPAAKDAPAPSTSMPPPPDPVPPLGILEGEITALSSCLQNAVVKTGQIYGFYADVKRLGIQKYAPHPPRTLTASLGREVEKYDQLCDAMESHLYRAIAVLQRDLAREEQRLKAEEDAAAAAPKLPSPTTSTVPTTTPPASPSQSQTETLPDGSQRPKPPIPTPARRQSTISLSSLQRPAFPHKLDLSASALRLQPEEMMPNGLSSPVTLAPRSARTSLPPELVMAAFGEAANRPVDIDLTVDADMDMAGPSGSGSQPQNMAQPADPSLGSSADKPIELDLDIDMEFFGDGSGNGSGDSNQNMFDTQGMASAAAQDHQDIKPKAEDNMDIDILKALQSVEPSASSEAIFASLGGANASSNNMPTPSASSGTISDSQKAPASAPSPGSFLTGFGAVPQAGDTSGTASTMASTQDNQLDSQNFDLNASFFGEHAGGSEMDMMGMDIFNMGVNTDFGTNTGGGTS